MTGRVVQINISRGGLPKRAVSEGVLTSSGFEGDSWAHPQIHGGPNQTVLMIASEAIDELRAKGYPVYAGALGENLTTEGLDRARWRAGQRYSVGEAVIELTKVRAPCSQLNIYGPYIVNEIYDSQTKAGNPTTPRWALSGFYARVVRPGLIFPGNVISLLSELA